MTRKFGCIATFVAILAFGHQQQKETPPAGGPPRPFHLAKTDDFTLPNGMRVTLVPYGVIPHVSVRAFVDAGGVNELANQVWLSRLTALLMKEGTESRSAEQIADAAADAGGRLEIDAGVEETGIGGVVLSDRAAAFIALVADVLQRPLLPASQVERLKSDLQRELAIAKTQPDMVARERFLRTIYPDSPYGRLFPAESELKGYSAGDVAAFYKNNFGAARTHLYVAGKLDGGLRAVIQSAFGEWQAGPAPVKMSAHPVAAHSFAMIDRPGAAQSTLYMGLPVADPTSPDYIPLDVMNALLGGSFASRITSNIREQKGYTYSPRSLIATDHHLAYWAEIADVTTSVTGPSLKEIFYEVDRLRKDPPSDSELKGIQNYLAGLFILRNTMSPDALIQQLRFVDSQGMSRAFLTDYVQKVIAVKPQDIQRVAEAYIVPSKMTIVVAGDRAKIADQVKPYETAAP